MNPRHCKACEVGTSEEHCWICGAPTEGGACPVYGQKIDRTIADTNLAPPPAEQRVGVIEDHVPLPEQPWPAQWVGSW